VPFKAKAACRRHIPKQQHRVINWAAYDAGLRARGSLTVWFTPEAIAAWRAEPRTGRGGQPRYSRLAITTALTLAGYGQYSSASIVTFSTFPAPSQQQQKN